MMRCRSLVAALIVGPLAQCALAANEHYICTIKVEYALQDSGTVDKSKFSDYITGKKFVVDRVTGVVRGDFISTTGANNIVVVDRGSEANSFKSYWTHPRIASAPLAYLEIRTFLGAKPPFLAVNHSGIYTGVCE